MSTSDFVSYGLPNETPTPQITNKIYVMVMEGLR